MGLGRDDIKYRDLFKMNKMKSPNPTSYKPEVYYNTRSFSMAKKLEFDTEKWIKQVPGPGNYQRLDLTNNKNEKRISKYLSAPTSKFSLDQRKGLANKTLAPGPGQCTLKNKLDDSPSDFGESLFDKPYSSKIGNSGRQRLERASFVPGPGS